MMTLSGKTPSNAGLRGSRPAELIEAAGAANRLERMVVSMFTRGGGVR